MFHPSEIAVKNVFRGNSTWAKRYENSMETHRIQQ